MNNAILGNDLVNTLKKEKLDGYDFTHVNSV